MTPSKKSYPFGVGDSERFWSKVNKTDSCWIWTSATLPTGYGLFRLNGSAHYAHRISFFHANGDLTPGLVIDHLCRTRNCVNPAHLREITRGDNVRVGYLYIPFSTHCVHGHEMDEENTYTLCHPTRGYTRQCRKCRAIRHRKHKARTAINEVLQMFEKE